MERGRLSGGEILGVISYIHRAQAKGRNLSGGEILGGILYIHRVQAKGRNQKRWWAGGREGGGTC